jgi:hypothetical protein
VKLSPNVALLTLLTGAAAFIATFVYKPAEPAYDGKPLSYWLHKYGVNTPIDSDLPEFKAERDVAEAAIRSIGTNAVPHLIAMAKCDPPSWRSTLVMRLPGWAKRFVGEWGLLQADPAGDASIGFEILGTNAQAAIPEMVKLMADKTLPVRARRATVALCYLGPGALPFMTAEMSNSPPSDRWWCASLMSTYLLPTMNSRDQLPFLLNALRNEPEPLQSAASNAVWRIAPELLTNNPAH